MSALASIDRTILQTVTAGSKSGIDLLLGELNAMTSSIDEIKNKTNGLDQGSMLVLCMLAMRRPASVVYVGQRWW